MKNPHYKKQNEDKLDYKAMWFVSKEMEQHYKWLFETWVKELRFQLLLRDSLLSSIDEVIAMTNDQLAKKVLEMAKERESLDRLIHARTIFNDY